MNVFISINAFRMLQIVHHCIRSHTPRPNVTQHHFSLIPGVLFQVQKSHVTTVENPKQDFSFLTMIYRYFLPSLYRIILSSILSVRHMGVPLPFFLHPLSVKTLK
jgi:hypothetical protein